MPLLWHACSVPAAAAGSDKVIIMCSSKSGAATRQVFWQLPVGIADGATHAASQDAQNAYAPHSEAADRLHGRFGEPGRRAHLRLSGQSQCDNRIANDFGEHTSSSVRARTMAVRYQSFVILKPRSHLMHVTQIHVNMRA